jgi:hypothetical protein
MSILRELARHDDLFAYPKAPRSARTLEDVFAAVDPSVRAMGSRSFDDGVIAQQFQTAAGETFFVQERGKSIWVNFASLDEGSGGSAAYAAIAEYAFSTGKMFIGDPEGNHGQGRAAPHRGDAVVGAQARHHAPPGAASRPAARPASGGNAAAAMERRRRCW